VRDIVNLSLELFDGTTVPDNRKTKFNYYLISDLIYLVTH